MEDGILYNLPNIERNILNNGVVEQGTLGSHLTHVRRWNETRRDEVMLDFGDIGQMLGLEVDGVPIIVELQITPLVCQDSNDLGVIGPLVEPIKRLRGDRIKIIKLVDRLRAEVYQHTRHPDLLDDVGGEVSVEFSYHTHRSWMRWLAKRPPSLSRNSLSKEIVGWWKPFSLIKDRFLQMVLNRSAAPLLTNLMTSKFGDGSSLARPRLVGNLCLLLDIGAKRKI